MATSLGTNAVIVTRVHCINLYALLPGYIAQSVAHLTADPGVKVQIPARPHSFSRECFYQYGS